MKRRTCRLIFFPLVAVLFSLCPAPPSWAGDPSSISAEDLQEVLDLIEDPLRREVFVRDLKQLLAAAESVKPAGEERPETAGEERRLLLIEQIFARFETLSEGLIKGFRKTLAWAGKTPEALARGRVFLEDPENRTAALRFLVGLAGSILIALVLGLLLRRYGARPPGPALPSRVSAGLLRIVRRVIPYGALFLLLTVCSRILPSVPQAQSLALLFFLLLFFYHLAMGLLRFLLAPEESPLRILPLTDVTANYYAIWGRRFTNATFFYLLFTGGLWIIGLPPSSYALLRALLLLVFPLMITVFILQIARDTAMRRRAAEAAGEEPEGRPKRLPALLARFWPSLAIAYAWAIFLFLISHYQQGFNYLFKATLGTALTTMLLFLALRLLNWIFERVFAINQRVRERFPGLEQKTNRYIQVLKNAMSAALVLSALGVTAQIWGIPAGALVASRPGSLVILRAVYILVTLGVVVAVIETVQIIGDYLLKAKTVGKKRKEPSQKMMTLVPVVRTALKVATGFVGGIVVLDGLGVNTAPILAGAGIVGLAVGFGSQTLVKDLINGLFLLFEESVRVGDYANLGNNEGMVEAVGLRTVRLRDVSGNVHIVPNSSIETVTNSSKEFSRAVLDIGVAYREDVDEVMDVLRQIGEEMRKDPEYAEDILEPLEVLGLQSFDDSAVVIRARMTTRPLMQWNLKREFQRRVKRRFDELGIEIPFPHQTLYMGEPKKGPAPPMYIQVTGGQAGGGDPEGP